MEHSNYTSRYRELFFIVSGSSCGMPGSQTLDRSAQKRPFAQISREVLSRALVLPVFCKRGHLEYLRSTGIAVALP